jgi:hypothetical protein
MQSRGDFKIMHEPNQLAFNLQFSHIDITRKWFKQDAPQTFNEVKNKILSESRSANVFVKEISFAIKDFLLNDPEFVRNPNIHFVFLLRNPHHSVISFYKKCRILDNQFSKLIGYKDCYEIFDAIKKHAINKPVLILSEDLYINTKETVETFCKNVEIDFNEKSLEWSNLGTDFDGTIEWQEIKNKEITHHWHGDAIRSTKFSKPEDYKVDDNGNPTFAEVKNEHLDLCKQAYNDNLLYYNLMLKACK